MTYDDALESLFRNSKEVGCINIDTYEYLNYLSSDLYTLYFRTLIKYKKDEVIFVPSIIGGEVFNFLKHRVLDEENPDTYEFVSNLFVRSRYSYKSIEANIKSVILKHTGKSITHFKTDKYNFYSGFGIILDEYLYPLLITGWDCKVGDSGLNSEDNFNIPKILIDPKVFTLKTNITRHIINRIIPSIIGNMPYYTSVYPVTLEVRGLSNFVFQNIIIPEDDPKYIESSINDILTRAVKNECV
jgi:hypothetical protein